MTGCTLLFALTMTMLVMSVKGETKGPESATGQRQENTRLFMDDLTTTTETITQTQHLLDQTYSKLEWGRLKVKAEKCRSLVILKGKISRRTVKIGGEAITSVMEKSVKYLGKQYNLTLSDSQQVQETADTVKEGLRKINRNQLP